MDFYNVHISASSIKLAEKVLESTWISEGKMVRKFEEKLSSQLGIINPLTVNSGTAALHLGLAIAGIKPGDEVILPAQTFVATGFSILMQYAKPVFADIQLNTGNVDPNSIRSKITERTKAIMPVHWGGYPCDLAEINQIAKKCNLAVIEDAAHALGANYKGKPIGSISRFTAFSFQAIKHVTTGDGGALCCLQNEDCKSAKRRRWFSIDRDSSKSSILGERQYDIKELGYKYHLNDIGAAIGLGNLIDFPKRLKKRQEIGNIYRNELANVPGLQLLEYKNDRTHTYWLFTIFVENRIEFIKKLKSQGIPTSVVHQGIDHNSIFGGKKEELINQRKFDDKQIAIPIHEELTDDEIACIIKTIKAGW